VDTEVPANPRRRQFSAGYKLEVLEQADRCRDAGAIGALLRREGLYSSHLASWRAARREGSLAQLSRKRGSKPTQSPESQEVERLGRENARLRRELEKARKVIEVQKKLSEILDVDLETPEKGSGGGSD
jgi:transposase-like protein